MPSDNTSSICADSIYVRLQDGFERLIKTFVIGIVALSCLLSGCQSRAQLQPIEPTITYVLPKHRLERLPSAFEPFNTEEKKQDWVRELLIGDAFARDEDFYRAITAYKRALFLAPCELKERRQQILYNIALCYYIPNRYQDVINTFEEGELTEVTSSFPAFSNLVVMLYDSYMKQNQCEKAEAVLQLIDTCSPETSRDLLLYSELVEGHIAEASVYIEEHSSQDLLSPFICHYEENAKSPAKARFLNAIFPGAGYYYVGQQKSAVTSFMINALFTAAAYQFFHRGYYAAGAITASLEMGWYLGGINGAGLEAKEYNERLYEGICHKMLADNGLFPVLMFETAF